MFENLFFLSIVCCYKYDDLLDQRENIVLNVLKRKRKKRLKCVYLRGIPIFCEL